MVTLDSLRTQIVVSGVAMVSLFALTGLLIRDVVVGAEERLVAEARQQCRNAAAELVEQYRARLTFREDALEQLPIEAQDVSLQALSATVLRAYEGLSGGFATGAGGATLGVAPAPLAGPEQELADRLTASDTGAAEMDAGPDVIVGASLAIEGSSTVAWALKRLPGANDPVPAQRRWLAGGLALSALLGLAALVSISLQLRRGVNGLLRGLARLESDLAYRLPPQSGDLGQVARSVNKMADARDALERHLREQERLAALGRVIGGVAHEIRNPLNSMRLTLELLERRVRQGRAEEDQVRGATAEVDRLDGILNRLLAFGKPGALDLRVQPLRPLVEEATRMAEETAKRKGVRVRLTLDGGEKARAETDSGQVEQVLLNLLLNAIEASEAEKTVEVRLSAGERTVRIEVADEGPGIADEVRDRIFEPYFTTKDDGNGLGLALSRETARRHGGDLSFVSRPGATVFTLTLPAAGRENG